MAAVRSDITRPLTVWIGSYAERLTASRVRAHAILLAAGIWAVSLWTIATPGPFDRNGTVKGVDFLQFYTAGHLIATGRADLLYEWPTFARELERAVPRLGNVLFVSVYPPPVAVFFAPMAVAGYFAALTTWTLIGIAVYATCARFIAGSIPSIGTHRLTWWILVIGFVPFQQVVMHGQIGTLILALLTCVYLALRRQAWFWAGVACGAMVFKPQFGVSAALLMLASGRLSVLIGVCAGAASVVGVSILAIGVGPWVEYGHKLPVLLRSATVFEPKVWAMHNAKGFFELLVGPGGLAWTATLLFSAVTLLLVVRIWRSTASADLRTAALVLATALLNPHLYAYDLVIVGLALATGAGWALAHENSRATPAILVLVHVLCWIPLLAPLAAVTHIQLTAPALTALLLAVYAAARQGCSLPNGPSQQIQRERCAGIVR